MCVCVCIYLMSIYILVTLFTSLCQSAYLCCFVCISLDMVLSSVLNKRSSSSPGSCHYTYMRWERALDSADEATLYGVNDRSQGLQMVVGHCRTRRRFASTRLLSASRSTEVAESNFAVLVSEVPGRDQEVVSLS